MNTDRNPTPRADRRGGNRRRLSSPTRYDGPRYGRTSFDNDPYGPEREERRRHRPERHPEHDTDREERRRERPGPGGPRGPRGHRRGGRRRDVRGAVLLVLAGEPMHGYQVMQAIADRTQGQWRPSPGAVYPALSALEDEGLLSVSADSGRKVATLTPEGIAAATELGAAGHDPFARPDDAPGPDLRESIHSLAQAAREVARTGTTAQQEQARSVLEQTRRALYAILAENPEETK